MTTLRKHLEDVTTLSADALEALFAMERQLGRQEGYAAALYDSGPKTSSAAMDFAAWDRYQHRAEQKYPLPSPERAGAA